MPSRTNPTCQKCKEAYERITGRYCKRLDRSVEYAKEPPCGQN